MPILKMASERLERHRNQLSPVKNFLIKIGILKDKRKFAKRYYGSRVYFTDFIKKNIDIIL